MIINSKFIELKYTKRIWAVGSIHSYLDAFDSVKSHILNNFNQTFKLIYKSRPLSYLPKNSSFSNKIKIRIAILEKI